MTRIETDQRGSDKGRSALIRCIRVIRVLFPTWWHTERPLLYGFDLQLSQLFRLAGLDRKTLRLAAFDLSDIETLGDEQIILQPGRQTFDPKSSILARLNGERPTADSRAVQRLALCQDESAGQRAPGLQPYGERPFFVAAQRQRAGQFSTILHEL